MGEMVNTLCRFVVSALRSKRDLVLENAALRHQLMVLQRQSKPPRIENRDRLFWITLLRLWSDWRGALSLVQPATVVRWRRILHLNVTAWPSARWTAQQVVEAFPYESSPRFLLRDRDKIFGSTFVRRVESMGIEEVVTVPGSPRQNSFCERLIGSIRRDCLDHVIVLNERHLLRVLRSYASYYHASRTHRSLDDDCPEPRPIEPADMGKVVAQPQVGGLHHRYGRHLAA